MRTIVKGIGQLRILGLLAIVISRGHAAGVTITLSPTPAPAAAQPGVTTLSLTCSNLPAGMLTAGSFVMTLQPRSGNSGPSLTGQVSGFTALPASGGRLTFQIVGPNVSLPTPYAVSVSGTTPGGIAFASAVPSALTINPPAQIVSVVPATANPGDNLQVVVTGLYTNFLQGSTTASLGAGISVAKAPAGQPTLASITSPTVAVLQIAVDPTAAPGPRQVVLATGAQIAVSAAGFTVAGVTASVSSVVPNSGSPGQLSLAVNITGLNTHFAQGVSQVSFGPGAAVASVAVNSATSVRALLNIDQTASPGPRDVRVVTGQEDVVGTGIFSITASAINRAPSVSAGPDQSVIESWELLVSSNDIQFPERGKESVLRFDGHTGAYQSVAATLDPASFTYPFQLGISPANQLYVSVRKTGDAINGGEINRYDLASGAFVDTAIPTGAVGGGDAPPFTFGPDGHLYLSQESGSTVSRYSPSGAFLGTFATHPSGKLLYGPRFGPDGNLYAFSQHHNANEAELLRFEGHTGAYLGSLATLSGLGLFVAADYTFGPDGNLYVSGLDSGSVARLNGKTGAFMDMFVQPHDGGMTRANGLQFGPDGNLYVADSPNNSNRGQILRYDGSTGHFIDAFVPINSGALLRAGGMLFHRLGAPITLSGIATDDGLPLGAALQTRWSQASGPGVVTFGNAQSLNTNADFSAAGIYVLRLTATDTQLTSTSDLTIIVSAANPSVDPVAPGVATQGQQNLAITIAGHNTYFLGTSSIDLGPGITVSQVVAIAATRLTALLNISANALPGPRTLTVTTGSEVVSLAQAFLVNPMSGTPVITQVNPSSGHQGQTNLTVTMAGQFTHWVQGVTTASFGSGITLGTLTINSPTAATAVLSVDVAAALGPRNVAVTTGSEVAAINNGFAVTSGSPVITHVSPNSGQQGQPNLSVTISGQFTHFAQGSTTASFGAGINVKSLTVNSGTSATAILSIDPVAATGPRTVSVTTETELVSLPAGFSVGPVTNQSPTVNAGPNQTIQQLFDVLVTNYNHPGGGILRFDGATGTFIENFVPPGPQQHFVAGIQLASDGNLYVQDDSDPSPPQHPHGEFGLLRYDSMGVFIDQFIPYGSGGLTDAIGPVFGPDGNLYVNEWRTTHEIKKYSGVDGAYLGVFATAPNGANVPSEGSMVFGPDGNLYVAYPATGGGTIQRFNGATGAHIDSFLAPGSNPLQSGSNILFHGQYLYVTDSLFPRVDRMDAKTGAFVDTFVPSGSGGLSHAGQMAFGPDGNLWIAAGISGSFGAIFRFDGTSGAYIDTLIQPQSGGLVVPGSFTFLDTSRTTLHGTATDDGLPAGKTLSFLWIQVSGPGLAKFASPNTLDTSVTFSKPGSYVLRLNASDSQLSNFSDVTINVTSRSADVDTVAPNVGTQGQTSAISITGHNTHFLNTSLIDLGPGVAFSQITALDANHLIATLTITASAPLGFRTLTVVTGAETISLVNAFTVVAATPVLTQVDPNQGQQGQKGLSMTITGQFTHFTQGTTTSNLGIGITIASLTVNSPTSATAVLNIDPAAATGARNVTVTTGSEVVTLNNGFTVTAVVQTPIIFSISPNAAQQGQGGPLSVVGVNTHFVQGTSVLDLGAGITVSGVTVTCATCLTAQVTIADTALSGPHNVTVTTGTEVAILAGGFTVQSGTAILTSMIPASGRQGLSLSIAFTGKFTHWVQGTTQLGLGAGINVTSVMVASPTSLTAQVSIDSSAAIGTRTPTITTGNEVVSQPNIFSVQAAGINATPAPASGQQAQTLAISITGLSTHFVQGTSVVDLGAGITVGAVTVASATSLIAQITIADNAVPGSRSVTITTGTEVASAPNAFTVNPGIIILSLNPGGAYQNQTVSVAITGQLTNFVQGVTQASFGPGIAVGGASEGAFGPISVTGPTSAAAQIVVNASATPGPRTVQAKTGSETATFTNGFSVVAPFVISSITPSAVQVGQQNLTVTVAGGNTHFVQNQSVLDLAGAGVTVASVNVTDATHLTAVVNVASNATLAVRDVSVTTGAETALLKAGFTVNGPPTLLSIAPNNAAQGQNNLSITIVGQNTHFANTSTIELGTGITFTGITATDTTHLTGRLTVASNTPTGFRSLTIMTGTEVVSLNNAFGVNVGGNQAPLITIAPTWSLTLSSTLGLTYTVTDDGLPSGGALTVSWSMTSGPGTVGFSNQTPTSITAAFSQAGTYVLRITATDTQLTTASDVTVTVTGSLPPSPTVSIASPTEGTEVTTLLNVAGTVTSPALSSWTLEFRMAEESTFRSLATGTAQVTNALLGTFDPTLLLNGVALIRLRATDTAGQTATAGPVSVVVTRNQKIGNFTVSFNDLTVPVAGLPIQVVRTYDSRNKLAGDFGVGWTLDLKTVRLTTNTALGDNWTETSTGGAFPTYCIQAVKTHLVTITFSDGTTYQFQPGMNPQCRQLVPIQDEPVAMTFTPTGITPSNAGLAILGGLQPLVTGAVPGPVSVVDQNTLASFNPDQYLLTLPDGRTLQISAALGLQSMTDLNGNKLTVSSAGITHSSGKSVSFQRDVSGRITQITDPAGNPIVYTYDLNGNLSTVKDRGANTTTFTYDANHGLLTILDPRGIQPIKNVYDSSGRLIQHIDAFGKTINYTHNLNTRQEVVTDRLGNVTVNEYDTDGNVTQVTDALGGITKRTYDARDNLLTETNALSKTRTYTYDANNNRLTEADPLGHTTTYTYNSRNQVLTITDPLSRVTTNTYDTSGNLLSTKDTSGNTTTFTYNAQGLRSSMTDALGGVTTFQYDTAGNLTQQTDVLNHAATYTYDANGNKLTESRTRTTTSGPDPLLTTYQYDALSRLNKTTFPDGSTSQVAYNSIGKQSVTTDQLGHQTSYTYDSMGRLTQTAFPDGTSEQSSYDAEGHRTASTDQANRSTTYGYDALGRLVSTTFPDTASTSTTYDAIGQVLTSTDPRGNATRYAYDDAARQTAIADALNHSTNFAYDNAGNQISMTDANGNTTRYVYDPNNRRTRVSYVDNTFDLVAYDALGRTVSKTDQAGKVTQFQYDKLGRLVQVTDALNRVTGYGYDELGNRVSQTDANSHTTLFAYDRIGRRTKRTLPLGMFETSAYDAAGNPSSKTDFKGKTTTYTYDAVNRLLTKVPDPTLGEPTVTFTYTATGQRASMIDASGTTTYTYGLRDRLLIKATPQGALTYTYDLAGNLLSIRSSNAGGTSVNYSYDVLNRLSTVTDNRISPGVTSYSYDAVGNLSGDHYPNTIQTTYNVDALNRLTNVSSAVGPTALSNFTYTLGPAGNRTKVVEIGDRTVGYTYDALYRLTGETIAGGTMKGTIGYEYDPVGNRLARTSTVTPVPAATSTYDSNDRLTTDTYDSNGNTTASGTNIYAYDFENHLKTQNGAAVTIVYDGDGNRVSKTAGATTNSLVDDRNPTGYAQVLEELVDGAVQRVYSYGLNRISQSQANGTSFYGYDGQGSVRILTDVTGAVTDRYDYDAFGNVLSQVGTMPNVYLYSGEQNDPNLGFYYLRARYYDATKGRFTTADAADGIPYDPIALHKYLYANTDPVNRVDRTGQFSLVEGITAATIVGVLAASFEGVQAYRLGETKTKIFVAAAKGFGLGFVGASVVYGAVWGVAVAVEAAITSPTAVSLLTFTGTTAARLADPARRVPIQILEAAIKYGSKVPDPQGVQNAFQYTIEMFKNGNLYQLEIVAQEISPGVHLILHFLYTR